jgi:hypothetical protein
VANDVLSSKWGGLNPSLLATIYPVNQQGYQLPGEVSVVAPPTEGNIELSANWQSPFEQSGTENKAPVIMQMLQSGTLQSYSEVLLGKGSNEGGGNGWQARLAQEISDFSREGQGRSGMTKLNSTQIFTGAGPIKIPLTLHFRAFDNPAAEVQAPLDQLARWTLARQLAPNGSLVSAIQNFTQGQGFLKTLLPSLAPQMVALRYGGYTFAPMVIESMSHPITAPRTADGAMLHVAVQVTLASLTALDQGDWTRARSGQPTQLFNN